jgi:CubicO group peptidase (beta-lactamase class C family)
MAYIFRLVLLFISYWQLPAYAEQTPQTLDELKAAIEKVRVESGLPGLGIALVDKNGPYWVAGLGQANLETKTPATENTLFRIGSTSKMFVALSVLKLVEEGKLHLDDKLSDLAPEIYFENPWEKTNPIRLVNLLEHTTGWDDIGFAVYGRQDATITLKDALDFHPQYRKSRWIPGSRYAYNNAGPAVAAYIVKKITGQVYEDYVQAQFFNPLQMTSTTFFESDLFKQLGATLYSADGKAQPYWHIIVRPAGAINSSASDMAKYLQFLIARGTFNQQAIISEASFTRMETPTTTPGAQVGALAGYGLHNYVTGYEDAGVAFHGHDGDVFGGHCRLSYIPELQMGYVLMVNQDNMQALDKIPKLIRAFLLKDTHKAKPKEIPLPEKFQKLSGYYIAIDARSEISRLPTEVFGVMRFKVNDNHLQREPLLGGWDKPSNDYATNENTLTNSWSGLPTIAIVQDPQAGEVVEVTDGLTGSLFKRVSALRVFGVLGWIGLALSLGLTSLIFAIVWGVRLARGKIAKGVSISIRLWPLITTAILFLGLFAPNIFQPSLGAMGEVSLTNVVIFFCSTAFPVLAVYSLINAYKHRRANVNTFMYWHSVAVSLLHCGLALCLAYYGLFAIRLWA